MLSCFSNPWGYRVHQLTQRQRNTKIILKWPCTKVCYRPVTVLKGLPKRLSGKESACQRRRPGFNPWVRKIPGAGNGNPPQYSYLGNPTDRGAWGVTKEPDTPEHEPDVHCAEWLVCGSAGLRAQVIYFNWSSSKNNEQELAFSS